MNQESRDKSERDELLTIDQLKDDVLNLPSKNWVYQRIHAGNLPFDYVKVGHYLRFPASSVRRYIEAQTRKPGQRG